MSPEETQDIEQGVLQAAQEDIKMDLMYAMQNGQISTEQQAREFMMSAMQGRMEEMEEEAIAFNVKEAKAARDKIETKLQDVILESGWHEALKECVDDIATFPAGDRKSVV